MAFEFRDEWRSQYDELGYVVFRGIVPPALLADLRRECDKARALAHELNGPQAQRLQPIDRYADRLDARPLRDFCELPDLRDAVTRLLGPGYTHGQTSIMGILVEPRDRPWTCGWHRDGVVEVPPGAYDELTRAVLAEAWNDRRHFNQVNCAIYADACTWFVPGSHRRQNDLPGERQTVGELARRLEGLTVAEAEEACLRHCTEFPGAWQARLGPGDYMVYRNLGWHNGNYSPSRPRATLHDICRFTHDDGWGQRWARAKQEAIDRLNTRGASVA